MKQALEPRAPSVRVITLKVNSAQGSAVQWKVAQARAEVNASKWILTVMVLPTSWEEKSRCSMRIRRRQMLQSSTFGLPAVQRVRRFNWLQAWEPFFSSDFSYQDFSFLRFGGQTTLKGTQTHNGTECYSLEEALANNPYYSKIETLVATASGLPVERDYYDLTGKLYKIERYEQIVTIQNVLTITRIVMTDLQNGY